MAETIGEAELDALEVEALKALVRLAIEGNSSAAASALVAVDRLRKTRLAALHSGKMASLNGPDLAEYLGSLGNSLADLEGRIGRKPTPPERAAHERGVRERLLEVRAVELGMMRRGEGSVPTWARR